MQKFKYKTTEIFQPGSAISKQDIDLHCQNMAVDGWELKTTTYIEYQGTLIFIWQKPAFPEVKKHRKGYFAPTDQQP